MKIEIDAFVLQTFKINFKLLSSKLYTRLATKGPQFLKITMTSVPSTNINDSPIEDETIPQVKT